MPKFFDGFQEERKQEELKKKYGIKDDKTLERKNVSGVVNGLWFIQNLIQSLFKGLFYLMMLVLSSIGLTTLLNHQLREILIEIVKNTL